MYGIKDGSGVTGSEVMVVGVPTNLTDGVRSDNGDESYKQTVKA